MSECLAIKGISTDLCDCIIATSDRMTENDPILFLFLETGRDKTKAVMLINALLDGDVYNSHNFKSRKEKQEFVEGKGRLFVSRVIKACNTLQ